MKIFFYIEFTGLHANTTLISIGLVSEDDRQFYGELSDYDIFQCDDWIKENVLANSRFQRINRYENNVNKDVYIPNYHLGNTFEMKCMLENWLEQFKTVEFVSDVSHYDMTLLINLFGNAFDLPKNYCPACYDINQDIMKKYNCSMQEAFDMSREDILYNNWKDKAVRGSKHNSLYDAKVIREIYQIINGYFDKR